MPFVVASRTTHSAPGSPKKVRNLCRNPPGSPRPATIGDNFVGSFVYLIKIQVPRSNNRHNEKVLCYDLARTRPPSSSVLPQVCSDLSDDLCNTDPFPLIAKLPKANTTSIRVGDSTATHHLPTSTCPVLTGLLRLILSLSPNSALLSAGHASFPTYTESVSGTSLTSC